MFKFELKGLNNNNNNKKGPKRVTDTHTLVICRYLVAVSNLFFFQPPRLKLMLTHRPFFGTVLQNRNAESNRIDWKFLLKFNKLFKCVCVCLLACSLN